MGSETGSTIFTPGVQFVLFVLVIVVIGVVARQRNKARISGLQSWALSRDHSHTPDEPGLAGLFPGLPDVDDRWASPSFENVIRGRLTGLPLIAFDYSYETSGTDNKKNKHTLQVLSIELPVRLPTVTVTHQGLGALLAVMFGGQDVRIGDEAFDRVFRVETPDPEGARRLLLPMAPALLAGTGQNLQTDGHRLILVRDGTLSVDDLEPWLQELATLAARVPRE